jgi:hypothetical protein
MDAAWGGGAAATAWAVSNGGGGVYTAVRSTCCALCGGARGALHKLCVVWRGEGKSRTRARRSRERGNAVETLSLQAPGLVTQPMKPVMCDILVSKPFFHKRVNLCARYETEEPRGARVWARARAGQQRAVAVGAVHVDSP